MYIRSKDEIFSELEPRLDRGDGVGGTGDSGSNSENVIMWISFSRRL